MPPTDEERMTSWVGVDTVARSVVEVIRLEHPGSQLDGSVVASLRVIDVEVDVDLLWVAVGRLWEKRS
jgi:hypothetical protein